MKNTVVSLLAASFCLLGQAVHPAEFPTKPVRLVIGFAAGGPLDTWTRTLARPLAEGLGVPVIVENRPGAEGALGADVVRKAPADGSVLAVAGPTTLASAAESGSFDPLQEFTPVSLALRFTMALFAHPRAVQSVDELLQRARAHPGQMNFGTASAGDALLYAQLVRAAGIGVTRVQYKGAAQMVPDLVSGRIDIAITPLAAGLGHVREDRLRALAVFTTERSPLAPQVPTLAQAGVANISSPAWVGVFAPAGLPSHIAERLAREMSKVARDEEARAVLARQAVVPEASTPGELLGMLKRDLGVWRESASRGDLAQR